VLEHVVVRDTNHTDACVLERFHLPGTRELIEELVVVGTGHIDFVQDDDSVVDVTDDEQPRRYATREIDLPVTTVAGDREYTITPALIDAVGRRETNADIDTYIHRHGVAGLGTALTYAVARASAAR